MWLAQMVFFVSVLQSVQGISTRGPHGIFPANADIMIRFTPKFCTKNFRWGNPLTLEERIIKSISGRARVHSVSFGGLPLVRLTTLRVDQGNVTMAKHKRKWTLWPCFLLCWEWLNRWSSRQNVWIVSLFSGMSTHNKQVGSRNALLCLLLNSDSGDIWFVKESFIWISSFHWIGWTGSQI